LIFARRQEERAHGIAFPFGTAAGRTWHPVEIRSQIPNIQVFTKGFLIARAPNFVNPNVA
jgi:hypothetical protein